MSSARRLLYETRGGALPFVLAGLAAVLLAVPASMWLARSPGSDLSQYERLGAEIGCICGTCPNLPIDVCGCGTADRMLAQLREAVDRGQTDEAILDTFETNFGPMIRIKPSGSGIDLAAWFAPMMLLLGGAVAVGAVLAQWRESAREAAAAAPSAGEPAPAEAEPRNDPYRALVERELDDLPD